MDIGFLGVILLWSVFITIFFLPILFVFFLFKIFEKKEKTKNIK